MGDSDLETMANVTTAEFDFNDESFDPISSHAKDFISKLLVKDKRYLINNKIYKKEKDRIKEFSLENF